MSEFFEEENDYFNVNKYKVVFLWKNDEIRYFGMFDKSLREIEYEIIRWYLKMELKRIETNYKIENIRIRYNRTMDDVECFPQSQIDKDLHLIDSFFYIESDVNECFGDFDQLMDRMTMHEFDPNTHFTYPIDETNNEIQNTLIEIELWKSQFNFVWQCEYDRAAKEM